MVKFAKAVIMLVRLIFLVELGLGIAIASAKGLPYLKLHIGLGFTMAFLLLMLGAVAAVQRMSLPVILSCVFAFLLPYVGLKQFPIKFGPALGAIQYTHVAIVLLAIGVAEFVFSRIKKYKGPLAVTITRTEE